MEPNPKLYPDAADVQTILQGDATGKTGDDLLADQLAMLALLRTQFAGSPLLAQVESQPQLSVAVRNKERTLHYIPYDFHQSGFEKTFIEACLTLDDFTRRKLEVYYNGAPGLTEFVIRCYEKRNGGWRYLGEYTPDFLILQRDDAGEIHKALIVETKGEGFALKFEPCKRFMEDDFLRLNREKFGYQRFDYLFLRDDEGPDKSVTALAQKITAFFD